MSRKLKIMQVLPALDAGGVECTVLELSRAVTDSGNESVVVSTGGNLVKQLEEEGARHIIMPVAKKSLSSFFQVKPFRKMLEEERPDILHLHSRIPAWIAWLAWRRMAPESRPHLVSTVHGFYSVNRYSRIMTCGEVVTAVSESARKYVLNNYPGTDAGKVRAIPLGVDPAEYYPGYRPSREWEEEWKKEFPKVQGKWTLCLPGRLTRIKGHEDFLQVIDVLKKEGFPVHGIIVGSAHKRKKKYEEEIRGLVREMNLENHITFTGHRSDLKDVLAFSNIVLSLTTVPESFGRTTLESLALGKPVMGYAHGGVEEQLNVFLPEGKVPVRDIKACIELLRKWYQSPPELPGAILPPYRLSDMTEANLNIYRELAGE